MMPNPDSQPDCASDLPQKVLVSSHFPNGASRDRTGDLLLAKPYLQLPALDSEFFVRNAR